MSNKSPRIPSYRHHKPSDQAVVTIGARDVYLGKYKSAASRAEYNRVIAEWTVHGGILPQQVNDLTVAELAAAFMRHAQGYYRRPDGTPATELKNARLAIRRLKLYGRTPATRFGPLALETVRQCMIDEGLARRTINHNVSRIRLIFKWATSKELIPPAVLQGLQAVSGLRAGRSNAKETAPVKPVPDAFVDAVLAHVSPQVAAMIELQRITGMRSGEVTIMRTCDINMSGRVWVYSPETHKNAWHGHDRSIYLGPKAQAIIKPFLKPQLAEYIFSPAEAEAERNDRRFGVVSASRKTPVYPSELRSREKRRAARQRASKRRLSERYDTISYYRAETYGIEAANKAKLASSRSADETELVPHWHPHQLRHNAATALRREHGIEVARIILGHRSAAMTEVYAEVDHARAIDVMAKIG
jgi:integrase